jgi:TIR domain
MPQLYRVFVSHAARDRWIAERIADLLRVRGARPFLDVYDIEKGDNIPDSIRRELNRADELVALFTSASQHRAWVWAEIAVVWGRGKRVIAVMHNVTLQDLDATTGLGPLGDSNAVDLNDFDAYLQQVGRRIGAKRRTRAKRDD